MLFAVFGDMSVSQQRCNHFLTESEMESVHLSLFTVIECVVRCGSAWPSTPVRFDKEAQKDRREHKANRHAYWTGQSTKTEDKTHTYTFLELIGQEKMSWTGWRGGIAKDKVHMGQKA